MNTYKDYDLTNLDRTCVKEIAQLSRIVGAEGIVLLKNENVLPFDKSKKLSIFGKSQIDYMKCGTGSGGMVNTEYIVNIIDGLKGKIEINNNLLEIYRQWLQHNSVDLKGWSKREWIQKEMPVSEEMCKKASEMSDYALVVIGRIAGESDDNANMPGSYLLSKEEEEIIKNVTKYFDKVCVALNTGNIIDMKWVDKYNVPCVLYSWQGGQEGGNSFADVILGDVSPSGRLTDTIAYNITDYPSDKNHGADEKNVYEEDIYVGYRYFETFAKDKVMYPFGYGLSYTDFTYDYKADYSNRKITVTTTVKNVGGCDGKTVVQLYYEAPQGKLGKPVRELIRYAKTKLLAVNESETLIIEFDVDEMAAYDDINRFAYILESGEYTIYAGENVRDAQEVFKIELEETVTQQLRQALAPTEEFKRIVPCVNAGKYIVHYADVPIRQYDMTLRINEHISKQEMPVGNKNIILKDVVEGKNTLDEFISQLTIEELSYLVKGEGMNSPKVTPGTGGAYGGVTNELLSYGVPIVCVSDGPSGIRMDTGEKATLIPNGTCLASSWNPNLVRELYAYVGVELRANNIDILLAPGLNIHRHPLNGRNFEYFSEDPYLTGTMAAGCTLGLSDVGVMGTIKHFACNSQERERHSTNAVVSERALREVYLKGFEIAVKEGKATAIMTSYNKINGNHAATNYDLTTSILRDEWGYIGFVMTDWWTHLDGENGNKTNLKAMIEAQNDIYMVTHSSKDYDDNVIKSVKDGMLDLFFLRKCVKNILSFILTSPAMDRKPKQYEVIRREEYVETTTINAVKSNTVYEMQGIDVIELKYRTSGSELVQHIISIFDKDIYVTCALVKGTCNKEGTVLVKIPVYWGKTLYKGNLKIEFSDEFEYINVTGLKKKEK